MTHLPAKAATALVFVASTLLSPESALRAAIGAITVVHKTSANDSTNFKQVEAFCPPTTIAFAGGASVSSTQDVVVQQTMPLGDPPTSWLAVAQERSPTSQSWSVTSWAICATVDDYELVVETTPFDSTTPKRIALGCPEGKKPIGVGAGILIFSPSLVLSKVVSGSVNYNEAFESTPTSASWALTARLSCAPPLDILTLRVTNRSSAESVDDLAIYCPGDRIAIGGFGDLSHGAFRALQPLGTQGFYLAAREITESGSSWDQVGVVRCYRP